ncbi:MAG: arsenite methyltransferase [Chlorobiaceae bacterium]|nr:arsenite methyltransferase [Chlorobiaceae bacterium]
MEQQGKKGIVEAVREMYASTATSNCSCCCGESASTREAGRECGYSDRELDSIPADANLGLGCGNPVALAEIRKGDVVVDLGSGAGIDCFLASGLVGEEGRVIGIDMTPEMIDRARLNASRNGYGNVEFREGRIEELPVDDTTADLVISNCVINLSTDKPGVFREAFRILKPGGRLMVSDIVLLEELPEPVRNSMDAYVMCVAGAMLKEEYLDAIRQAGFLEVVITSENRFPVELALAQPKLKEAVEKMNIPVAELARIAGSIASIRVSAKKAAV